MANLLSMIEKVRFIIENVGEITMSKFLEIYFNFMADYYALAGHLEIYEYEKVYLLHVC